MVEKSDSIIAFWDIIKEIRFQEMIIFYVNSVFRLRRLRNEKFKIFWKIKIYFFK